MSYGGEDDDAPQEPMAAPKAAPVAPKTTPNASGISPTALEVSQLRARTVAARAEAADLSGIAKDLRVGFQRHLDTLALPTISDISPGAMSSPPTIL
jgi:hypothetical protein